MAWTKFPQGLIDLFEESLPDDPLAFERRKMFGYPCAGLVTQARSGRIGRRSHDAEPLPEGPNGWEPRFRYG
jgi:hypothetical protein